MSHVANRPAPCCSQFPLSTPTHERLPARSHVGTARTSSNVPPGINAARLRAVLRHWFALRGPKELAAAPTQPPEQNYEHLPRLSAPAIASKPATVLSESLRLPGSLPQFCS